MRVGGDTARSQEIGLDLDSPTVRRNVGNVLPADAISARSSTIILGQEIHTNDYIDRRVTWAQRGIGASALLAVLCYITGQIVNSYFLRLFTIALGVFVNIFIGVLYCNNFSFVIVKRLSKEPNVIIIAALTVFNLIVDIATSHNLLGPVFSSIYLLTMNAYVFSDALIWKSRSFMICIGALFVILNVFNIYGNTFGDFSNGVVLLEYTVENNTYTIMKREVKRSIYIQIIIFSAHSVYVMCVDRSMELMVFATGNVYKRDVASLLRCNNEGTQKRIKWAQCFTLIFFSLSALSFSSLCLSMEMFFTFLPFLLGCYHWHRSAFFVTETCRCVWQSDC